MNKQLRKTVIAGNWKMNNTPAETVALIEELKPLVADADADVVLCVPFVDLQNAVAATEGTNIKIGSQNVHFEARGAFTGEISTSMLTSIGVKYAIVGHSERRQYFGETDATVNLRARAAIAAGMTAIICVGERIEQRNEGITTELVTEQTKIALSNISKEKLEQVIIAYEPVWAIGTGLVATDEQANEVCGIIRNVVAELYDADAANGLTIQYGGSMNAGNAAGLLAQSDVDGGLIGGASLKAKDFALIVKAASV